jgi:hypothetical protein
MDMCTAALRVISAIPVVAADNRTRRQACFSCYLEAATYEPLK